MRLGQLARKLALRPSQIVDYLATQQVFPVEGSNARLSDEVTERVIQHFAPERLSEILTTEEKNPEPVSIPESIEETRAITKAVEKMEVAAIEPSTVAEASAVKPEVIKAPKVELTGLKVLGKIELEETKKKPSLTPESEHEVEPPKDEIPAIGKKQKRTERKEYPQRKETLKQRVDRNPIAEQRERMAREEEENRKAKAERDKEKRTQYYLQRVKTGTPTKAVKMVSEPVESFSMKEVGPVPKTWWGKFMRWLNT